ncbi:hypothetical protein KR038_009919, partial [Drosophila bunnanda]
EARNATIRVSAGGIVLNKIPAVIRPSMKRAATVTTMGATGAASMTTPAGTVGQGMASLAKAPKYVIQATGSSAPQWQARQDAQGLGVAISSLPPNTIIKATTRQALVPPIGVSTLTSTTESLPSTPSTSRTTSVQNTPTVLADSRVSSAVRQAVFIKRNLPLPQRSMRSLTLSLMEQSTMLHLGVAGEHLPLLKRLICRTANIAHLDCFITLRKLRQNEPFALLAQSFELSELDTEELFKRTLIKLARCLAPLIRWPDVRHHHERLKHTPLEYRANLLHLRSMIECVETDVAEDLRWDSSSSYKFILCFDTNGVISYVSSAYPGRCDDLQLFEASKFRDIIPKYLTLCAEPGKAVPRVRKAEPEYDSGDELDYPLPPDGPKPSLSKFEAQQLGGKLANQQSLSVVDGALTSKRAPSIQLPTLRVQEQTCRAQMRDMIDNFREFRILGHSAIQKKSLLGYLDEMIIVAAALSNLKRQELYS